MMNLRAQRTCIGGTVTVKDWLIPVVYTRADDTHADLRGEVVIWPPAFTPDAAAPDEDEGFVGHDDEIQALDRAVDAGTQLVFVHGLIGQGKTALLREFQWWRDRTGDHRPTLWVDFEQQSGASDVLWTMAQALPDPPVSRPSDDLLERRIVDALNEHPRLVVWDHTHLAEPPVGGLPTAGAYTDADRGRLAGLVGRLRPGISVVLAAGRQESSWLQASCRSFTLLLPGLNNDDRWALVRAVHGHNEPVAPDESRLATEEHLTALVTFLAGHPMLTRHVARLRPGRPAADAMLDALREGAGIPADLDVDGERIRPALHCLRHPSLARVIPQILLHGPVVDWWVLAEALREMYGDEAEAILAKATSLLRAAGLADSHGAIHPMLGGAMRAQIGAVPVSHDEALAFLAAVRARMRDSGQPGLAVALVDRAADLAIDHRQFDDARQFGLQLLRVGEVERGQWTLDLCATLTGSASQQPGVEVAEALQRAELALSHRQFDQARRWTGLAQARIRSTAGPVSADLRARLLRSQGMLAEATSDWNKFGQSMIAASRLVAEITDTALAVQIAHYASQLATDPQQLAEVAAAISVDESVETRPGLLSYVYQVRARSRAAQGEIPQAREAARRAVSLAKLSTDGQTYANAQAVLGNVELEGGSCRGSGRVHRSRRPIRGVGRPARRRSGVQLTRARLLPAWQDGGGWRTSDRCGRLLRRRRTRAQPPHGDSQLRHLPGTNHP
ncbi:AAA family ATPase [Paractinoplanes durhamensis]|uniref:AAA family ATPase n=1 Tax=Paractinoplanes durhamensis TaxID=113563 RepID=UPI00363FC2AD